MDLEAKPPRMRRHKFLCPTILYVQVLSRAHTKLLFNISLKYIHKFFLSLVPHFSYLFFNNVWSLITRYSLCLCIGLSTEMILVHTHLGFSNFWRLFYNLLSCEIISKGYNLLICSTDWRQSFRFKWSDDFPDKQQGTLLSVFLGTYLVSRTCPCMGWWRFLSWKKQCASSKINYTWVDF